MFSGTVLCVPRTEAIRYASRFLSEQNIRITEKCAPDVTHVLLPVPSFSRGDEYLAHLLTGLPDDVILCGGNLSSPLTEGYPCLDFLQDPYYLADNAAITAECTVKMLRQEFKAEWDGRQVLIIGWGRIGKCLAALLWALEAEVTVVARKEEDRAMAHALGYHAEAPEKLGRELDRFQLIYNTAPAAVLTEEQMGNCRETCLKIDLASVKGIQDTHVIWARGLPGKDTPGSSGKLIAKTIIRLLDRKERL